MSHLAVNLGKWVLRNLFLGFIREEQKARREQQDDSSADGVLVHPASGQRTDLHITIPQKASLESPRRSPLQPSSTVVRSPNIIPAIPPATPPPMRTSPLLTPMIPLHAKEDIEPNNGHRRLRSATLDHTESLVGQGLGDQGPSRTRQPSVSDESPVSNVNGTGGLMGRLRQFGRTPQKRPVSEVVVPGSALASAGTISVVAVRVFGIRHFFSVALIFQRFFRNLKFMRPRPQRNCCLLVH